MTMIMLFKTHMTRLTHSLFKQSQVHKANEMTSYYNTITYNFPTHRLIFCHSQNRRKYHRQKLTYTNTLSYGNRKFPKAQIGLDDGKCLELDFGATLSIHATHVIRIRVRYSRSTVV